jgi:hypothetical protein
MSIPPPPPPPSGPNYGGLGAGGQPLTDPFAGRPRRTHFQEPLQPYASTASLGSTTTLPRYDGQYDDDEKIPLRADQGSYPP